MPNIPQSSPPGQLTVDAVKPKTPPSTTSEALGPVSIMRAKTPPSHVTPAPPSGKPRINGKFGGGGGIVRTASGFDSVSGSQHRRRSIAGSNNVGSNTIRHKGAEAGSIHVAVSGNGKAPGGYTSALELKSGSALVSLDDEMESVRIASAPIERPKRITFAPDVTGVGIDDADLKRNSISKRTPPGSSLHENIIADLTSELAEQTKRHESHNTDLQSLVTEQSQRIAELEAKLKESERKEAAAIKEKLAAVKELEANKKFMFTDLKSGEQLKAQLQEEHQTNASLIIFNRSLKTQVAELEGIIETLMQQKGASPFDIQTVLAKLENLKPTMPKTAK
ncbi:hypothetical protein HDU82_006582 [Entophlyctis luteolus]|nr:hypothetical protein HDU82_006582 [Entophlyctis luteolus]